MRKTTLLVSMLLCMIAVVPAFACPKPRPHPQHPRQHVQTYYTLTIWPMSCNGAANFGHVDTNVSSSATTITVPAGVAIEVNAHANPGWLFEAFYVDNVQIFGRGCSVTVRMCGNITLRVQFNPYPT